MLTRVPWAQVRSPLLSHPHWSLKDPAPAWHEGWFYIFCSAFTEGNRCSLVGYRSRDLVDWCEPLFQWGKGSDGWCSPDVVRDGNRWIMTFQSWDGLHPRQSRNQLFYAESSDLVVWSAPRPLAPELTEGVRAIDPAIARCGDRWYMIYKEAQQARLATAPSLDGPWSALGKPFDCWAENAQLLMVDGRWHVVATTDGHTQSIAAMVGDGSREEHWRSWEPFRHMHTPVIPGFNEHTPANASALLDLRHLDGFWYRFFCARQVALPEGNMGYTLGVARLLPAQFHLKPGTSRWDKHTA